MNPPAPCTVTLPAHRPPASTPPPAPFSVSASRESVSRIPARTMRHNPCLRASCPEGFGALRVAVTNHAHPSLARGCPRRQSSLARLRSPIRLRAAVSSRAASSRALPQAQPSALAALALASTAANAAPAARVASGCPSGQRPRYVRRPAARAFSGRGGVFARPLACVALRAKSPRPRLASLAPRRVRLRLTPSPRSRRRANLPLHLPSHRAQRRSDSAVILPLLPPCPFHVASRSPPASEWLAMLAPVSSKGARRRALATPLARG